MLKKILCLALLMIPHTYLFSQDTLRITTDHIKIANNIFIEHKKFSEQIPLLKQQINNLEQINTTWVRSDSIKNLQITNCYTLLESKDNTIEDLNKSLKNKKDIINYGGIAGILTLVLCLILK